MSQERNTHAQRAARRGEPGRGEPALAIPAGLARGAIAVVLGLAVAASLPVPDADAQSRRRSTLDFKDEAADTAAGSAETRRDSGDYRVRSNDIVRFGESVVIEADERVRGDVVVVGGSIRVRGYVEGDVVSVGGSVVIEPTGEVRGEAVSVGGKVEELGGGRLRGSSVTLPGRRHLDDWTSRDRSWERGGRVVGGLVWLGLLLLFGWLATRLSPARLESVRQYLEAHRMASFLWGIGAFVFFVPVLLVVVFAAVLLCITIIGIPLGIALLLGYFVGFGLLLIAGFLAGASGLGHRLAPRFDRTPGIPVTEGRGMTIGILGSFGLVVAGRLLHAIWIGGPLFAGLGSFLSVVGWIVASLVLFLGVGALLASGVGGLTNYRWARMAPPPPGAVPPPAAAPPASPSPPALPVS